MGILSDIHLVPCDGNNESVQKKNEYRDVTTDVNQERWGGYLAIETDRRDINGEGVRRFDDVTVFRKPLGF